MDQSHQHHRPTRNRPATRLIAALAVISGMTIGQTPVFGAENWRAERFEVFVGSPVVALLNNPNAAALVESEYEENRPPDAAVRALEDTFNRAGDWLRKHNFPGPLLQPVVDTADGPAYRVYLCSNTDSSCQTNHAAVYITDCGLVSRSQYLIMPIQRVLDGQGVSAEGYQSVVHELMHAIFYSTPYGRSIVDDCNNDQPDEWISEGIPDAISFDLRDELFGGLFTPDRSGKGTAKEFGARPYDEPLPQDANVDEPGKTCNPSAPSGQPSFCVTTGYTTSSFWRYIERVHDSELTYGYLLSDDPAKPGLLDLPMEGSQSWERDVRWANRGLINRLGYNLKFLYSLFIADLALRVPESDAAVQRRQAAQTAAGRTAADALSLSRWVNALFPWGCEEVILDPKYPHDTLTLTIKPMAAACLWVNEFDLPGLSRLSFVVGADDPSLLRDISVVRGGSDIGVIGGKPFAVQGFNHVYYAGWQGFMHDGSERTLYLVTNFATNPVKSRQRTFDMVVSLSKQENSAVSGTNLPAARSMLPKQKPTFRKRSKTLDQQRAETRDIVQRQMEEDKNSLSTKVDGVVEVARRTKQPPCAEPFRYAPCGPHMQINLQLRPGSWGMPAHVTGAGGQAAQFFGGLQAMTGQLGSNVGQDMQEVEARLDRIPGSFVGIKIPMIDYGFSGSFDNAAITVNMDDGRPFEAIGPPDASGQSPLVGQVTIEEYTPYRIAGSFVAPLAEFEANGDQPPIFRPRETISGTFNSPAPFLADERSRPVQLPIEEQAEDVAKSFGISGDVMKMLKDAGAFPGQPAPGNGQAVDVRKMCDCDCAAKPHVPEVCHAVCEAEYAACD